MSGYRGYRNYRGRGSKGKAILSAVLILVIVASIAFMILQKYIIYDETGTPRLILPEWGAAETPQEDETLNLTIQAQESTAQWLRAFSVPQTPLTLEGWQRAKAAAEEAGTYNAAVIFVKNQEGAVCFDAYSAIGSTRSVKDDTALALREAIQGDTAVEHTIAGLSCFRDPYAAEWSARDMGLLNTGGYLFRDEGGNSWTDPGKPQARQYLCSLAVELAQLGFDEILLTDVTYPTEGDLDAIDYGETMKTQNILTFLEEMERALADYDVALSIQLPEAVVLEGSDNLAGLMLEDILPWVDRIYAEATTAQAEDMAEKLAGKSADFLPILPPGSQWEDSCVIAAQ